MANVCALRKCIGWRRLVGRVVLMECRVEKSVEKVVEVDCSVVELAGCSGCAFVRDPATSLLLSLISRVLY
jgi:hypothetical protein